MAVSICSMSLSFSQKFLPISQIPDFDLLKANKHCSPRANCGTYHNLNNFLRQHVIDTKKPPFKSSHFCVPGTGETEIFPGVEMQPRPTPTSTPVRTPFWVFRSAFSITQTRDLVFLKPNKHRVDYPNCGTYHNLNAINPRHLCDTLMPLF